jgi:DoxX-like family
VLGIAAAVGLALLMVGGIVAHARAQDLRNAGPAALLLVLAVATVVLRVASM